MFEAYANLKSSVTVCQGVEKMLAPYCEDVLNVEASKSTVLHVTFH